MVSSISVGGDRSLILGARGVGDDSSYLARACGGHGAGVYGEVRCGVQENSYRKMIMQILVRSYF